MKPREFWLQIKQHDRDWLHGCLNTNIYTPEHIEITQDYKLKWHNDMCVHVIEYAALEASNKRAMELEKENEKFRKALEFYANTINYTKSYSGDPNSKWYETEVDKECGKIARRALGWEKG